MPVDRKIKLAIIGTTGLPARYGGFETLAHHLVDQLKDDYEITVYCSTKYYKKENRIKSFNRARLIYFPFNANGYQSIIYDFLSILHALIFCESLLVLGVSGCMLIPFVKLISRKPVIVNIDGLEWKRAKWGKYAKKFLKWSEKIAVKFSDRIVTDNAAIQNYVKAEYGKDSTLIEYGADHVMKLEMHTDVLCKYIFLASPYAFTVCRIEPENNVHVILESFARNPQWNLVIVGLWDHGIYGLELKKKYSEYPNILLLDPIYNQYELDSIRCNCALYIHGHLAGGTNPSLVEAMYLGLPVIAFDVAYNRETTENKAIYFESGNMLDALLKTTSPETISRMAENMKEIALRRYRWEIIADKYRQEIDYKTEKILQHIPEFSQPFYTGNVKKELTVNYPETY